MNEDKGLWKWQLVTAIDRIAAAIEQANEIQRSEQVFEQKQEQIREKRSEAGKRSAEIRLEKFGTAVPGRTHVRTKRTCVRTNPNTPSLYDIYSAAYQQRYPIAPIRNVKVNSQLAQMEKQLGYSLAAEVLTYYVTRNDAFYIAKSHPVGPCLADVQKLVTELRSGTHVTMKEAQRLETDAQNQMVIEDYARKRGIRLEEDA